MAGLNKEKVAEGYLKKGDYKKAADFYDYAGDSHKAHKYYKKSLETTPSLAVINNIQSRLTNKGVVDDSWRELFNEARKRRLERYVGYPSTGLAVVSVIMLLGSLLSISMNLTGNVIGGSSDNNNWISIGLFFLGCTLTLFYFKAKNRSIEAKSKKKKK